MRRTLTSIVVAIAVTALAAACGDDDDGSQPSESPAATGDSSMNASTSPEPTLGLTPMPGARLAVPLVGDIVGFMSQFTSALTPVTCEYEQGGVIVDCTNQGLGKVQLSEAVPGLVQECRALLYNEKLVLVSCITSEPASAFPYQVLD